MWLNLDPSHPFLPWAAVMTRRLMDRCADVLCIVAAAVSLCADLVWTTIKVAGRHLCSTYGSAGYRSNQRR